jgi:hypothetical protein
MKNRFEEYLMFVKDNGKIVEVNMEAQNNIDEAFELFKSLFDNIFGSIVENDNLISIHSGGWSDNEDLINEFKETAWWWRYHNITATGGHYYFNTDHSSDKEWIVSANK